MVSNWAFNSARYGVFSKVCNAVGTPTVNLSSTDAGRMVSVYYNGFLNIPTVLWATDSSFNTGTGTTANSGNFSASYSAEAIFALYMTENGTNPTDPIIIAASDSGGEDSFNGGYQLRAYDTTVGSPAGLTQECPAVTPPPSRLIRGMP